MIDYYLVYRFIKGLTTPFSEWDAFKYGIIDADGIILKSRKNLNTSKERDSFTLYDVLMLNIKKLLHKLPGGNTKLASYAAALFLIKEHNIFLEDSILTESCIFIDDNQIITFINEAVNNRFNEDIANSVGAGSVSGLGGQNGEPGAIKKRKINYKYVGRKTFSQFIGEQDAIPSSDATYNTPPVTYGKKQRRNKKHPTEAIPLA